MILLRFCLKLEGYCQLLADENTDKIEINVDVHHGLLFLIHE